MCDSGHKASGIWIAEITGVHAETRGFDGYRCLYVRQRTDARNLKGG
jgi:hypothetical protein